MKTVSTLLKIWVLTALILACVRIGHSFFWEKTDEQTLTPVKNESVYTSAYSSNYSVIGVALSTRVGTNFRKSQSNFNNPGFYREISSVWKTQEEKQEIRDELIKKNMILIREYLNLAKTDVKGVLETSNNKKATLENLINQLSLRYKNATVSSQSLEKQKALLLAYIEQVEAAIAQQKWLMEKNFSASDPDATIANVERYFELRQKYTEAFTDIVFINQFIKQYSFLNNYNKLLLDTLINNKEPLINGTSVVIPNSWDELLEPLNLLIKESVYKTQK